MKSKAILILPPHESNFDVFKLPSWNIGRIPPVGLITIGSYLQAKGHDVKIIDCRELIVEHKTNEYIPLIPKIVDEFKPDVIGINIFTALFDEAKKISCELKKKFPDCLIIAGGVHPSIEPVLTFQQNQYIDAICIGAGEEVCLDILDGKKIGGISGLMRRGYIDKFAKRPVELDIDKYPFPNYALANSNFYTGFSIDTIFGWGYRGLGTLTSRSCPYSCKFCASDWSKPFRYHSPEYIVEMVKHLSTYDIDVITFWDDTIAAIKERLYKMCQGFIQAKLFYPYSSLRWFAPIRASQIDPDTLRLMKEAGCFGVTIGIESGSDRMLKVINKKTTVGMNKRACAYVQEAGLNLVTAFMFGIPGETEGDMKETLAFMQNVNCSAEGVSSFRPLPGSPFYDEFIKNGTLSKEDIDWSNLGNFSIAPEYLFCDVSREKIDDIFDKALDIANRNRWTTIHEDTLSKYPNEIKSIASRTKIKIAKPGNYESSTHITYAPFSIFSIYNTLLSTLRTFLPYKLRKRIRPLIRLIRRGKAAR